MLICASGTSVAYSQELSLASFIALKPKMQFLFFWKKSVCLNYLTDLYTYLGQRKQDKKMAFTLLYSYEWGFRAHCS